MFIRNQANQAPADTASSWRGDAQARINEQGMLVARLLPGTAAHEMATYVLLALQDTLFVLSEARAMIEVLGGEAREG